jgi:hypothetical protein
MTFPKVLMINMAKLRYAASTKGLTDFIFLTCIRLKVVKNGEKTRPKSAILYDKLSLTTSLLFYSLVSAVTCGSIIRNTAIKLVDIEMMSLVEATSPII